MIQKKIRVGHYIHNCVIADGLRPSQYKANYMGQEDLVLKSIQKVAIKGQIIEWNNNKTLHQGEVLEVNYVDYEYLVESSYGQDIIQFDKAKIIVK